MLKSIKTKIGNMPCRGLDENGKDCAYTVPVLIDSITRSLSYSCQECRCGSYAKNDGSPNYAGVMARVTKQENSPTSPAKKPFSVFG